MRFGKYLRPQNQIIKSDEFILRPISYEDRYRIMKWRNDQLYHLRQKAPLDQKTQDDYFLNVVAQLFQQEYPNQMLFSLDRDEMHIAYGGLVHIDWKKAYAELSFVMNTDFEALFFETFWATFLKMIEPIAKALGIKILYTAAYDLRPQLYTVLEKNNFQRKENIEDYTRFINQGDIVVHAKTLTNGYEEA